MRWVLLSLLAVAIAVVVVAVPFLWSGWGGDSDVIDVSHVKVEVPVELAGTPVFMPALTHEAQELRRVAEEHARLLTSIPPTPTLAPTVPWAGASEGGEENEFAGVSRAEAFEGIELGVPVEGWFDPKEGLDFHRDAGGDWTPRPVRQENPYAEFFYFDGYPPDVASFANGRIYEDLARNLAFGASEVVDFLGTPTPEIVRTFMRGLGWELRSLDEPYINVWTTFDFYAQGALHRYAVGGVVRMDVVSRSGSDGELLEYLVVGPFVGPVVVERLGVKTS